MKYFNLFSNIKITKGINRALFSDLQRNISELYPLELNELVESLKVTSIENLFDEFDSESKVVLQEYLTILLDKEYGFVTINDWDTNFPVMPMDYYDTSSVSNLFIELEEVTLLNELIPSIDKLSVKYLVLFSEREITLQDFLKIDSYFDKSTVVSIEIYAPFFNGIDADFINHISEKTSRIYRLVFYNCAKIPLKNKDKFKFSLEFVKEKLVRASCGKVSLDYFNTNITKYTESINHNSCLNKKMSIDKHGNIKNCPSMPESFGNIKDTTLETALDHPNFKKYWNVTKDEVEICKDCEFRYICTDCRAYVENPDTMYSKPLKCGYSPYTSIWEEWSKNPLKQKAIQYYQMQDIVKK